MSDWKYICWEANGAKVPIIFPNRLVHKSVARGMGYAIRNHVIEERPNSWSSKVLSAGFISGLIVTGTHGMSESMDMGSNPDDRSIINTMPYTNGHEDILGVERMVIEAVRRGLS